MRPIRVLIALWPLLLATASCAGGSAPVTSAATTTPATPTTAAATTTGLASTTTATTTAPPLRPGEWPGLPVLAVAAARDGDLMIAGPEGIMLVRTGEPLGLLATEPAQAATPDGLGGFVYHHPPDPDLDELPYLVWVRADGSVASSQGHDAMAWSADTLRLQEVDWVPRLGRDEWGSWIPQSAGISAWVVGTNVYPVQVLLTTRDPLAPVAPFIGGWGVPVDPERTVVAQAWTGRHQVVAWIGGGGRTTLAFARVDGTLGRLPHNPASTPADGWIENLDAEPGSSLLAYTVGTDYSFASPAYADLHVVDLSRGAEVFSAEIGDEHQWITRIDLHDGHIAVSAVAQAGFAPDLVRLVDLATGAVTTLPWAGTASFFHLAAPVPAALYPIAGPAVPELVVTSPLEGTTFDTAEVRFEGYATPGATVTAAGRFPVQVSADGLWSTMLALQPGGNLAEFQATLPGGGRAETAVAAFLQGG